MLGMATPKQEKPWWKPVADRIVRENLTFRQAAGEEGLALGPDESARTYQSRTFQRLLWQARFEYYNEIGNDPQRTKVAVIGLMQLALKNLADEGEWKEVLEGAMKLAKVEGWLGTDNTTTVFANLTQKDIDEARKALQEAIGTGSTTEGTQQTLPN